MADIPRNVNLLEGLLDTYADLPADVAAEGEDVCWSRVPLVRPTSGGTGISVYCTVDNQPGHVVHMAGDGTKTIAIWRTD